MRVSNSTLFGLLLAILMFMPIPLTMVNGTAGPTIGSLNDSSLRELKVGKTPPVPGPDLVESNWTSNRLQNPDFEDWIDQYDCVGWEDEEGTFHTCWLVFDIWGTPITYGIRAFACDFSHYGSVSSISASSLDVVTKAVFKTLKHEGSVQRL